MDEAKLSPIEKKVFEAEKEVIDPELNVGLVDLGLIYDIKVENGVCEVTWSLTTMGCPIVDILQGLIFEAAMSVKGIKDCHPNLVYYPQWTPEMMSKEARISLGIHI